MQTLLSLQFLATPPQAPPLQVSSVVQNRLSSQDDVLLALTQASVVSLQESVVQTLLSPQFLATPPQVPPPQVSPVVQNRPSLQGTLLLVLTQTSVVSLQESVVQTLLSPQLRGLVAQLPPLQMSPVVQNKPSSQGDVLFAFTQTSVVSLQESVVHTLLSLQFLATPPQVPPLQVSPVVQKKLSSQETVFGALTQKSVVSLQLSVVQTFASAQVRGVPLQTPPLQVSPVVQNKPSSQATPLLALTQMSFVSLQLSVVQTFASAQLRGLVAQIPPLQTSPVVQNRPSLQGLVLGALTQTSLISLQESFVQTLLSLQILATPPQVPPPHVSPVVQNRPSSQGTVLLVLTQTSVVSLQVSVVQTLLSLQLRGLVAQIPPLQTSPVVQKRPSSQGFALGAFTQTSVVSLQLSVVHTLLSLQFLAAPPQVPPPQVSPVVQKRPSLQGTLLLVLTQRSEASLQLSVVQTLLSLQVRGAPEQVPPVH